MAARHRKIKKAKAFLNENGKRIVQETARHLQNLIKINQAENVSPTRYASWDKDEPTKLRDGVDKVWKNLNLLDARSKVNAFREIVPGRENVNLPNRPKKFKIKEDKQKTDPRIWNNKKASALQRRAVIKVEDKKEPVLDVSGYIKPVRTLVKEGRNLRTVTRAKKHGRWTGNPAPRKEAPKIPRTTKLEYKK